MHGPFVREYGPFGTFVRENEPFVMSMALLSLKWPFCLLMWPFK